MTVPAAAHAALEREAGGPLPAGLDALSPAEAEHLTSTIRAARARQAAALGRAVEDALSHIPLLLRGAVRRFLRV